MRLLLASSGTPRRRHAPLCSARLPPRALGGEQHERIGDYEGAALAYEREAALETQRRAIRRERTWKQRRARRLATDLRLAIPSTQTSVSASLAKFEPVRGCYLGVRGESNAEDFERRLDHPVAVVFDYAFYGEPFPWDWARREADRGRAIQIAWEPNDIDAVRDDEYLERYADDAARSGAAIFLRFGGEMNGDWTPWHRDPAAYVRAFRLVHDVMARRAPNVAMVWAPNPVPFENIDRYYPGDDVVDWVGLSLYVVRYYDDNLAQPAWQDNPMALIEPTYRKYAARKPICLVECGVTRRSRVENADADEFAAARIQDLMDAIRVRFPRLKMMCWFDRNNLTGAIPGRRLNDYSLPERSYALDSLGQAAQDSYFLGRFEDHTSAPYGYEQIQSLPRGYHGDMIASLSTYSVFPKLDIRRGTSRLLVSHPYRFSVPPGTGLVTITVRDQHGHVAQTVTVASP